MKTLGILQPVMPGAVEPAFEVAGTVSLQEGRTRTLKHGDTFVVVDHNGNVEGHPGSPGGLYHNDTRYLSQLEMRLFGIRPMLLGSAPRDDNATLTCDLTNPDLFRDGVRVLPRGTVQLSRSKFLWQAACYERVMVRSFADAPLHLTLDIAFAADFADLFEVRGRQRPRHGTIAAPQLAPDCVTLAYTGLDRRRRTTRLRFDPPARSVRPGRATFTVELPPHGHALIFVEVACDAPATAPRPPREAFLLSMIEARRALRAASSRAAAIATSNEVFNEAVRRSVCDLMMLVTDKETGPYPYAGVPWFSAAFGRDALITAFQTLWLDPAIARGVLRYLARHQAVKTDPVADSEPGKILHEVRSGEMAKLGEVPFGHYYGSVDSTPLFIMLAGAYLERTADIDTIRGLWPNLTAAVDWIDRYGDRDGDGFVEYARVTEKGLANQGWKDSYDSIFHADGRLAGPPIALCEVQGYVYAARRAAADIARRLGHADQAIAQEKAAERLRIAFEARFWCEELGTYALALDGNKQPCRVRSSNAGHLLMTGIAAPERALRVAQQLMSGAFFSGWGVRTVASGEARFNPMSYHNGSVWPHDNALIALGLARIGRKEAAGRIFQGLFEASTHIELRRLPELFCGFPRRRGQGPTSYPVACSPQAWSAAAPLALLQACLGVTFAPEDQTIRFDQPILPAFLDRVTLHNLELGEARISVQFRRTGQEVAMNVLSRTGPIRAAMTA